LADIEIRFAIHSNGRTIVLASNTPSGNACLQRIALQQSDFKQLKNKQVDNKQ